MAADLIVVFKHWILLRLDFYGHVFLAVDFFFGMVPHFIAVVICCIIGITLTQAVVWAHLSYALDGFFCLPAQAGGMVVFVLANDM